jgi:hypothetical protein
MLPLIRSWDFGTHHPAVIFSNLLRCELGHNHFISLAEISQLFGSVGNGVTVYQLYDEVKKLTKDNFKDASRILDCGDRAGYRTASNRKDKRSEIKILQIEFGLTFKHRFFDLDNSIRYCRTLLNKTCECGREIIQVDRNCETLIEALEGGYKFTKSRQGVISDKPLKDKYYDDVADAWRYGLENYVKWVLPDVDNPGYRKHRGEARPWDWMEATEQELAEMVVG